MFVNRADRESAVCVHNGGLFGYKEKRSHEDFTKRTDGFGNHYVKWGGQFSERQSLMFPLTCRSQLLIATCVRLRACVWVEVAKAEGRPRGKKVLRKK